MDKAASIAFWEGATEFAWSMFGMAFLSFFCLLQCGVFDKREGGES